MSNPRGARRDSQRGRVYDWENRVIAPHDPSTVPFAAAQGFVDAIWAEGGLAYPPRVEALPRQTRVLMADATRLRIRLPPAIASWCLLHEIAHAMTSTIDGRSDGHGPEFMGVYVGLLARYLRLPLDTLVASLRQDGIGVNPDARPMFLDGGAPNLPPSPCGVEPRSGSTPQGEGCRGTIITH